MTTVKVEMSPKLLELYSNPRGSLRYRVMRGGRGSGKSFTAAKMAAVWGAIEPLRILCVREFQNSIKESMHAELKNAIHTCPWLSSVYDVGIDYLRHKDNGTEFVFKGLRHNIEGVKSMAQIDLVIAEEAETIPSRSWLDLVPTIRAPKSEIWVIYNPRSRDSWVAENFDTDRLPPRTKVVTVNYGDNPWFPEELEEQRQHAQTVMSPELYAHVWDGQYLDKSDAQVFKDKYRVADFDIGDWGMPLCGLDFGFSQDPTAAVKCWIDSGRLYISHCAGKRGLELDDTADYIAQHIPDFNQHPIIADSARPESISHLKRHGLPKISGASKGKGSVEDGISFMRSFAEIIIHPRCKDVADEFLRYSYKTDKYTGRITDQLNDSDNHYIDAIRYALEPVLRDKPIQHQRMYKPTNTIDKIPLTLYELTIRVNGRGFGLFGRRLEDEAIIVLDGGYWQNEPLDGVVDYLKQVNNSALITERMASVIIDSDDTLARVIKDQINANDWVISIKQAPKYKDWLERSKECEVLMSNVVFLTDQHRLGSASKVLAEYDGANRDGTQPRHDLLDLLVWETLSRHGSIGIDLGVY